MDVMPAPGRVDRPNVAAGNRFSKTKLAKTGAGAIRLRGRRSGSAGNQRCGSSLDQRFRGAAGPAAPGLQERAMTILKWALIFFLVSIVAGILGFTGISAASADVARFLFYVFVVIFLVLLILGLTIFRV
jgi:uncharacterized membrane protein YtjA (UPF0391 family)